MKHTPNETALREDAVWDAARQLVAAFARHDTTAYFAAFAADARFIFHSHPERLDSRAAYATLWAHWEQTSGFRVMSCHSSAASVQRFEDTAIFLHDVETTVRIDGSECTLKERETIVFAQQTDGRWLAVHEHLSPLPTAAHEVST